MNQSIGSYKLIQKVGEGTSGIVYKVEKNSEMYAFIS